jgi:lipopolysaccharide export system permease protein
VPGQPQFRVIEFAEHGIPYALQPRAGGTLPPEARSSLALYRSGTADDLAELHWRIGVPLTLFVLAIIAVPLARTEPRKGRFSGLAPAVLLYVIYANLLAAGKGWLERGQLPPWAGLWWVHALFLAFAGGMLAVQQGWWTRLRLRRQRR